MQCGWGVVVEKVCAVVKGCVCMCVVCVCVCAKVGAGVGSAAMAR